MEDNGRNLFWILTMLLIAVLLVSCCNCQAESPGTAADDVAISPREDNNSDDEVPAADKCRSDSDGTNKCQPTPMLPHNDDSGDQDHNGEQDDDVMWWPILLGVIAGLAVVITIIVVVVRKLRKPVQTVPVPATNDYITGPDNKGGSLKADGIDGFPQTTGDKTEPPPAYTSTMKDSPDQMDAAGGTVRPPPYTIQLPPYIPAGSIYSIDMAEKRSMTPVN
jgi:uncharacterized membrane protein YhaH (DUF805 family)